MVRLTLNDKLLSATAFDTCSRGTKSTTIVCRAGMSKALAMPEMKANTITSGTLTLP